MRGMTQQHIGITNHCTHLGEPTDTNLPSQSDRERKDLVAKSIQCPLTTERHKYNHGLTQCLE